MSRRHGKRKRRLTTDSLAKRLLRREVRDYGAPTEHNSKVAATFNLQPELTNNLSAASGKAIEAIYRGETPPRKGDTMSGNGIPAVPCGVCGYPSGDRRHLAGMGKTHNYEPAKTYPDAGPARPKRGKHTSLSRPMERKLEDWLLGEWPKIETSKLRIADVRKLVLEHFGADFPATEWHVRQAARAIEKEWPKTPRDMAHGPRAVHRRRVWAIIEQVEAYGQWMSNLAAELSVDAPPVLPAFAALLAQRSTASPSTLNLPTGVSR